MRTENELLDLARRAVNKALAAGADQAEAFVAERQVLKLACHGDFATPEESHATGMALRIAVGRQLGTAGASGYGRVDRVVGEALERARGGSEHPHFEQFTADVDPALPPTPIHASIQHVDPDEVEADARWLMDSLHGEAVAFRSCGLFRGWNRYAVVNSQGLEAWDQRGKETVELELRVEDSNHSLTVMDVVSSTSPVSDRFDLSAWGKAACDRGTQALDGGDLEEPVQAVVLEGVPTSQLVRKFVEGLSGSLVLSGNAPFEKTGTQVATPAVTVRDLPSGPTGSDQRCRIDHEGVPTRPLTLIDRGHLKAHLHDSITGGALGCGSNGHAVRGSGWLGGVGIAPIHPVLEPGGGTDDRLMDEVERAVLVTDPFAGIFTADPTSGDFSLVAPYTFLVEDGEVTRPLRHTTIGGNIHTILSETAAVGEGLRESPYGAAPRLHAQGGVSCAT